MDEMKYVAQEESGGCMVATIAMIVGKTYAEIRAMCEDSYQDGIHWIIAADILADLGYATMSRYHHHPRLKSERGIWPCAPFAPAHFIVLEATQGPHAVAADAFMKVFDPFKRERESLAHPDYGKIHHIEGIFKVGA